MIHFLLSFRAIGANLAILISFQGAHHLFCSNSAASVACFSLAVEVEIEFLLNLSFEFGPVNYPFILDVILCDRHRNLSRENDSASRLEGTTWEVEWAFFSLVHRKSRLVWNFVALHPVGLDCRSWCCVSEDKIM